MEKISATIITKNEEKNIDRCLFSLDWVDEIVVVDSGSTDKTLEICKKYGCKIFQTEWMGFGKTKQLAVDKTSNNWVLSIDADEYISKELKKRLINFDVNNCLGYKIKRSSFYLNRKIKYSGWQSDFPIRLFNKEYGGFNQKEVHESIEVRGLVCKIKHEILHYPFPSITAHVNKINLYTELGAQELFKKNKKTTIIYAFISGISKFIKMYFIKFGFLDGKEGLILAILSGYYSMLKYLKLWSLYKK